MEFFLSQRRKDAEYKWLFWVCDLGKGAVTVDAASSRVCILLDLALNLPPRHRGTGGLLVSRPTCFAPSKAASSLYFAREPFERESSKRNGFAGVFFASLRETKDAAVGQHGEARVGRRPLMQNTRARPRLTLVLAHPDRHAPAFLRVGRIGEKQPVLARLGGK